MLSAEPDTLGTVVNVDVTVGVYEHSNIQGTIISVINLGGAIGNLFAGSKKQMRVHLCSSKIQSLLTTLAEK